MVICFEEVGLEEMSMNLESLVEMVGPTCFEIIFRTHPRVLCSCPRPMVVYFAEYESWEVCGYGEVNMF